MAHIVEVPFRMGIAEPSYVTAAAEAAGIRHIDQHTLSVGMLDTVATVLSDGAVFGIGFGRWAEVTLTSDQA